MTTDPLTRDDLPDALRVLRPGDRVLFSFRDAVESKQIERLLDQLREWFPDVAFHAVAGAEQIIVQPAEEDR